MKFDKFGACNFPNDSIAIFKRRYYILGLLNSNLAQIYLDIGNATINYQPGDIARIPVIYDSHKGELVEEYVLMNIMMAKSDWDSEEVSWDFKVHPLV